MAGVERLRSPPALTRAAPFSLGAAKTRTPVTHHPTAHITRREKTDVDPFPRITNYSRQLAARREVARVEQLANFGLALGWVLLLVGGFCWFCVVSALDGLWLAMLVTGGVLLALAVLVPEALERPCRWWMTLAHWQGWLVMTVLLTAVYFALMTPVGWLLRGRRGTHPFHTWDDSPPPFATTRIWEALPLSSTSSPIVSARRSRSLPRLLLSTIGFFFERGHYLMLPVLIVLLTLGLLLFFVQGSVLAPFIYTIF